jgi:hypothetical protein
MTAAALCVACGSDDQGANRVAAAASGGLPEVYEATTGEGSVTLELGAGGKARLSMKGLPGSDLPENVTFDVRYEVNGNDITVDMPGDEPIRLMKSGEALVSTMGGETVRFTKR